MLCQWFRALAVCVVVQGLPAGGQAITHASPSAQDAQRGVLDSAVVVRVVSGLALDSSGGVLVIDAQHSHADAEALSEAFAESGVSRAVPVLGAAPSNEELARDLGLDRMYMVMLAGGITTSAQLCARLGDLPGLVESAQAVRVGQTHDVGIVPNDPLFPLQYALHNTGQSVEGVPGVPGADVNALLAWSESTGSARVPIAVLDAGVSYAHPDLFFKVIATHNTTGGPSDDADDPFNSHGTHVAGIAAAGSNNGLGIVGMSWGSSIIAVKVANPLGFTSDVWFGQGLIWAADHGARVAVASLGFDAGSDFLHAAVRYATRQGVVLCASTGNTGQPGVKYPARYPETIAVGATDNKGMIAEFSTTGPEVTVVAPGLEILSAWDDLSGPPTYAARSGTSASCPLVGGIVALMLSVNPDLETSGVIELIRLSVIDGGPLGFDPQYGWGRIDAYRAVTAALGNRACAADINQNGIVEASDFSAWIVAYAAQDPLADQNFDGLVTPADFSSFLANYLQGCP